MLHLNFTPFPVLETERLVLRQLSVTDENEIFKLRSDEKVNEFIDRPRATSIEDARNFIQKRRIEISSNNIIYWAIALKTDPALIGTILYWNIEKEEDKAEIGYELLPSFQGKGIMQEALLKVIEFGFETMKLQIITAYAGEGNKASIKLLERINFKRDSDNDEQNPNETIKTVAYVLSL